MNHPIPTHLNTSSWESPSEQYWRTANPSRIDVKNQILAMVEWKLGRPFSLMDTHNAVEKCNFIKVTVGNICMKEIPELGIY